MSGHMKAPCEHCPYRKDVHPFLRRERGFELAVHSFNPYNTFPCHKTTVPIEDAFPDACNDDNCGELVATGKSKECAGFLTLQIINGAPVPEGFVPATDVVYKDAHEMIKAYNKEGY